MKIPASRAEHYVWYSGQTGFSVDRYVREGLLPPTKKPVGAR